MGGSEDETKDDDMTARSVDKAVRVAAKEDRLARESREIGTLYGRRSYGRRSLGRRSRSRLRSRLRSRYRIFD